MANGTPSRRRQISANGGHVVVGDAETGPGKTRTVGEQLEGVVGYR